MRVLVTGSTTWTDVETIRRSLSDLPAGSTIVTGDTGGVDALAGRAAGELGLSIQMMKKSQADYAAHPKAGWKGLNERMLATGIDLVLAFHADYGKPDCARGTRHMVELAQAAGVEARIVTTSIS
jgi:hypothetical protein